MHNFLTRLAVISLLLAILLVSTPLVFADTTIIHAGKLLAVPG